MSSARTIHWVARYGWWFVFIGGCAGAALGSAIDGYGVLYCGLAGAVLGGAVGTARALVFED
ncbi:MAG: hypothetical protein WD749_01675 [Phycisphaerales bacterium]